MSKTNWTKVKPGTPVRFINPTGVFWDSDEYGVFVSCRSLYPDGGDIIQVVPERHRDGTCKHIGKDGKRCSGGVASEFGLAGGFYAATIEVLILDGVTYDE